MNRGSGHKSYLISRSDDGELVVDDPSVSHRHAVVHVTANGRLEIEDVGSTNGTFVRGQRLDPGMPVRIEPGERVTVGRAAILIDLGPDGVVRTPRADAHDVPIGQRPVSERRYLVTSQVSSASFGRSGPPPQTLFVPVRQLSSDITFYDGAKDNRAYALHPYLATHYVPIVQFHPILFAEKLSELLRIMAAQGASRTHVKGLSGLARRGATRADGLGIGAVSGAVTRQRLNDYEFEERYPAPPKPYLPRDLVWYPAEPEWREVIRHRMDFGVTTFKVHMRWDDHFDIEPETARRYSDWERHLSVDFEQWESSVIEIEGDY